jgi:hypothetical protein
MPRIKLGDETSRGGLNNVTPEKRPKAALPRGVGQSSFRLFSGGDINQGSPRNLVLDRYGGHFLSSPAIFML